MLAEFTNSLGEQGILKTEGKNHKKSSFSEIECASYNCCNKEIPVEFRGALEKLLNKTVPRKMKI